MTLNPPDARWLVWLKKNHEFLTNVVLPGIRAGTVSGTVESIEGDLKAVTATIAKLERLQELPYVVGDACSVMRAMEA